MLLRLLALLSIAALATAQNLVVIGASYLNIRTVAANDTATTSDYTILGNATSAAFTETLPAGPMKGEILRVKKIDSSSNAVTISGNGFNIDGASTQAISTQYTAITMQFDGSQWWVL